MSEQNEIKDMKLRLEDLSSQLQIAVKEEQEHDVSRIMKDISDLMEQINKSPSGKFETF